MRVSHYLEDRNESQDSLARRASQYVRGGVSQRTIARAVTGQGIQARTAYAIIQASVDEPTPGGGTITLRDLVIDQILELSETAA